MKLDSSPARDRIKITIQLVTSFRRYLQRRSQCSPFSSRPRKSKRFTADTDRRLRLRFQLVPAPPTRMTFELGTSDLLPLMAAEDRSRHGRARPVGRRIIRPLMGAGR